MGEFESRHEGVEYKFAEDVTTFLNFLDPRNEREWISNASRRFLFRGQASNRWELVPKAYRHGQSGEASTFSSVKDQLRLKSQEPELALRKSLETSHRHLGLRPNHNLDCLFELILQTATEFEFLSRFAELADEVGLALPNTFPISGLQVLRSFARCGTPSDYGSVLIDNSLMTPWELLNWPPNELVGLAQHHGIPTRLLDWSYDPYIAAYFACSDSRESNDEFLAVWAIDRQTFVEKRTIGVLRGRSTNNFLRAQAGAFTYSLSPRDDWQNDPKRIAHNDILRNSGERTGFGPTIRCYCLRSQCVEELRHHLFVGRRISSSHLMPFYDNVAKDILSSAKDADLMIE